MSTEQQNYANNAGTIVTTGQKLPYTTSSSC